MCTLGEGELQGPSWLLQEFMTAASELFGRSCLLQFEAGNEDGFVDAV